MSLKKPKAPAEDPAAIKARERQMIDLSKLDEQENARIKQLMMSSRGSRVFKGSPLLRATPSNTSGHARAGGGLVSNPSGSLIPSYSGGGGGGGSFGRGGAAKVQQ